LIGEEGNRPKWRSDSDELLAQLERFQGAIRNDEDIKRLEQAHMQLGKDLAESTADIMSAGMGQTSWIWTDVLNVYLPRVLGLLKTVPIPR
jgi:hypothetical protein